MSKNSLIWVELCRPIPAEGLDMQNKGFFSSGKKKGKKPLIKQNPSISLLHLHHKMEFTNHCIWWIMNWWTVIIIIRMCCYSQRIRIKFTSGYFHYLQDRGIHFHSSSLQAANPISLTYFVWGQGRRRRAVDGIQQECLERVWKLWWNQVPPVWVHPKSPHLHQKLLSELSLYLAGKVPLPSVSLS